MKFTYKELRAIIEIFDYIINSVDTSAISIASKLSEECKRNIKYLLYFDDDTLNDDKDINVILVKTFKELTENLDVKTFNQYCEIIESIKLMENEGDF